MDQVLDVARGQQVARCQPRIDAQVFGTTDDAAIAQVFHRAPVARHADRRIAGDAAYRLLPFFRRAAQQQMGDAQAKLDSLEVEGVAGGGLVKIRATAKGRILSVSIDDSLIVPEDKQMLEDLVTAAFNDARGKADRVAGEEMGKIQSGMGLPPGLNIPGFS